MIDLFLSMNATYWLILGLLLLTLELLGAGGYLLWIGGAALSTSVVARLSDIRAENQWVLFATLSVLLTLAWYLYQRRRDRLGRQRSGLNQRARALVGSSCLILTRVTPQGGRVKLGDSSWLARSEGEEILEEGTQARVIRVEGTLLMVTAKDPKRG
ncbi:NfeD family protein [Ferrimonas sediminicola]|uniref:NfeD family protein n=1 Tax=Ferrimonas sediminicola TaxID=2569538 RepID=A0A4U1BJZ6_9GAMM|nr:NfeD family protein [Ferrimonas sediminicola]TKB51124.1 NfeD family protein [Ferrimonas sediminicola]